MRVERVSKKFCRSLKRSPWYGIGDIAGELNPFAGGKGHGVEGGGKPLDALQSTGAHGRSGQLAESHPQGSTCGARAATSVHVSSEGEGGTKGLKDEGLNGPEDSGFFHRAPRAKNRPRDRRQGQRPLPIQRCAGRSKNHPDPAYRWRFVDQHRFRAKPVDHPVDLRHRNVPLSQITQVVEGLLFAPTGQVRDRLYQSQRFPVLSRVCKLSFPFPHATKFGEVKFRWSIQRRMAHQHTPEQCASGARTIENENRGFFHPVATERNNRWPDRGFSSRRYAFCQVSRQGARC